MVEGNDHNWRELCKAASETRDNNEFLKIVQELNNILESEEQKRREFRRAAGVGQSGQGVRAQ
jgi:hypothetical protein